MSHSKIAIAFTINQNRFYWQMLFESIQSIRRHSKKIRVIVFVFGKMRKSDQAKFKKLNVEFIQRPQVVKENAWSLKWLSLAEIDTDSLLMCDVDTYFYDDPVKIFKLYRAKKFYARKEIAMGSDEKHGPMKIQDRLNHKKFSEIAGKLKAKKLPIFNAGLMLFNHQSHKKWNELTLLFLELVYKIRTDIEYSKIVARPFFADEIAGALCLGKITGLSWGYMDLNHTPFYSEQRFKLTKGPALVVHYNTAHSHQFFADLKWEKTKIRKWVASMKKNKVKPHNLPNFKN